MSYKKSVISYGIWALYLMGVGIVLSFMGMVIGNQNSGIPYMALTLLALSFGLLFAVYFLGKRIVDNVRIKEISARKEVLVEGIVVALSLMVGIVLRVVLIGGAGEEAAYYEVAKVTEDRLQLQLVQGSIYYYLCLLNGLFRLVGNKWMAGVVLQIVLQLAGILLAYFAVRRLAGSGPSLISLLFLTMAPGSVREGMTYSPKMLYFCLYAFVLLMIAQFLWLSTRSGVKVLTWILAALCGALVAFAGYTDIVGFTLAIPLLSLPWIKREQKGMLQWVAQFFLSLFVMVGTFCLLVYVDGAMSGSNFERVLNAWSVTYCIKGADYDFFFRESGFETILLLIFMALGIFTFMRRRTEEIFSPWVLMVLSIVIMRILGIVTPNMNGSYQMFFAMTGLAGVALSELFVRDGGKVKESVGGIPEAVVEDLDQDHAATEPVETIKSEKSKPVQSSGMETATQQEDDDKEWEAQAEWESLYKGSSHHRRRSRSSARAESKEVVTVEKKQEEPQQSALAESSAQEEQRQSVSAESAAQEEQRQSVPAESSAQEEQPDSGDEKSSERKESVRTVQYIDNPLPLPKKHVKKVMDYPITPDASQMHFDVEVDPQDDFDF